LMLIIYFVLSGSLLQPHTVLTAYLFTSLFAARGAVSNQSSLQERSVE
jgi:hypothetical protein